MRKHDLRRIARARTGNGVASARRSPWWAEHGSIMEDENELTTQDVLELTLPEEDGGGEDDEGDRSDTIAVRIGRRVAHLRPEAIDWFEAGNYFVKLHIGFETHLLREKISVLEERLNPARFVRIHRSVLVNVARVRTVDHRPRGEHLVVLHDGTTLRMNRSRLGVLEQRMRELAGQ
jgi:DNA-binding LytR/AlgR family response regulator